MDRIEGIFNFDPSDKIYNDHFPGNAVVPGSLILNAFLEAIREAGFKGEGYVLENFRFKGFVSPGEYPFVIQKSADQIKCRLYQIHSGMQKTLVTGTIKI